MSTFEWPGLFSKSAYSALKNAAPVDSVCLLEIETENVAFCFANVLDAMRSGFSPKWFTRFYFRLFFFPIRRSVSYFTAFIQWDYYISRV